MGDHEQPQVNFRDFYDPECVLTDSELPYYLEKRIPAGATVYGLGHLTSRSAILLAESLHGRLLTDLPEGEYPFTLDDHEAESVQLRVENDVSNIVTALYKTVQDVRTKELKHVAFDETKSESDVVLASRILSSAASQAIRRESGRDYYMHPHEVAQIIRVAARRFHGLNKVDLDRLLFAAYAHDAFEDTIPRKTGTFLTAEILISPLVVSSVLGVLGDDQHRAIANTHMLMSKPIGPNGKMTYDKYISRGLEDPRFDLIKLADTQHNDVIEPKIVFDSLAAIRKLTTKVAEYRNARETILITASRMPDINLVLMAHAITAVTKEDIRYLQDGGRQLLHHNALATLFRKHVRETRAEQPV